MTKESFERLIEEHKASELSLINFLTEKKMSVPQYYYWKKKFKKVRSEAPDQFINITSRLNKNSDMPEVELIFPNGIRINFSKYPGNKVLLELVQR